MTPTEKEIHAHLQGKDDMAIDNEPISNSEWWQMTALELLLRHQLELREGLRQEAIEQLNKDICKEVTKEVLNVLRNHLVIPLK